MKHPFFVLFFVVIPLHYILKLLLPEVGAWLVVAHGLIGGRTLTRLPVLFELPLSVVAHREVLVLRVSNPRINDTAWFFDLLVR